MYLNYILVSLCSLLHITSLNDFVEQAALGLLHAKALLLLLEPSSRTLSSLSRTSYHKVVLQEAHDVVLRNLGATLLSILEALQQPVILDWEVALANIVTDIVTESIRQLVALLCSLEYIEYSCRVSLYSLLVCSATLAKSLREECTEQLYSLVMRLLSLLGQTTLHTLLYNLDVERNVAKLLLDTATDVSTKAVRQRVQVVEITLNDLCTLASARANQCSTSECYDCHKCLFHTFLLFYLFSVCLQIAQR